MLPNVGIGELMLVLVIGLLVVGPQRLPEITRAAAKAWRTFQQETGKAKAALREAIDEPTREIREAFMEPQAELRASIEETRQVAKTSIEETRKLKGVFDRPDGMPAPTTPRTGARDPHYIPPAPEWGDPAATPASSAPPSESPSVEPLPLVRDYEDT